MPKTFLEAFEEWKRDTRYQVGDDIGWEHPEESCPTQEESSLTPNEDGDESSTQA
jgi:hypothetical protein